MSIDRIVFAVAGSFIMLSLALGMSISPLFHHEYWLFFTAFVGLNLFQSAFTGFCPLAMILKAFGAKPGHAFN
jgi:NO-binding membrane sensor protein with MHYT domain